MSAHATTGSPLWQIVFLSFGAVLILFEVVRGFRQGLPRQLVRLIALACAYACALFVGPLFVPVLRPFVRLPDLVISPIAGALLALIVYAMISLAGRLLFKPTRTHESAAVRVVYGMCGGAVGVVFGLFFIWLLVVGLRSLGSVADAQLHARVVDQPPLATPTGRQIPPPASGLPGDSSALATVLARIKNSVELGGVGELVKQTDVLPAGAYQTLGKLGDAVSKPQSAQRLLEFPSIREIAEQPKIKALRDDPEIMRLMQEGRYLELLRNPRLIKALNDPQLAQALKKFDLQRALDYAAGKP